LRLARRRDGVQTEASDEAGKLEIEGQVALFNEEY
jgi:hypothetical protein